MNKKYKTMNKKYKTMLVFPAVITLLFGNVSAQNLITNGSFEDGSVFAGFPDFYEIYSLPGWTGERYTGGAAPTYAGALDYSEARGSTWLSTENIPGFPAAADGSFYLMMWNDTTGLDVYQDVTTVVGTTYTLTGNIGNPELGSPGNDYAKGAVYVNGTVAASVTERVWESFTYNFTATSNTTRISMDFISPDIGASSEAFVIDNLVLLDSNSIPEPSSSLLIGLGAIGIIARRKRV